VTPDQLEHDWDITTQALHSVSPEMDFVYPLCEPSDDSGMNVAPNLVLPSETNLYGGWIWPFIKVRTLWDELFANAAYTVEGNILSDDTFNRLYMPISSRNVDKSMVNQFLYSSYWTGSVT
jgi:hypothetical protein